MIIRNSEREIEVRANTCGGEGSILFEHISSGSALPAHTKMFSDMVFEQGCSIAKHYHMDNTEYYYVVEGEGEIDDNGVVTTIKAGDAAVCYPGNYHSIKNIRKEPLRILGVIVTND